jgi:hypothetical protein
MTQKRLNRHPNKPPIPTQFFGPTSGLKNEQKIIWISTPILHPFKPNFEVDAPIAPNTQKSNKLLNKYFYIFKSATNF